MIRFSAYLLLWSLMGGCTSTGPQDDPNSQDDSLKQWVWPQPPLQARIRYLTQFASSADFRHRNTLFKRMTARLFGRQARHFIRPVSIVVAQNRAYVADPAAAGFWIVDLNSGRFKLIYRAGKETLVSPVAIVLGSNDDLYVADSGIHQVLRYDLTGQFLAALDTPKMDRPVALAFNSTRHRLYIADVSHHHILITDPGGKLLGQFGSRGAEPGQFNYPTHLTIDAESHLLVTDALNFRIQIFDANGRYLNSFGHHGDGSGDLASPKGIATDKHGNVFVVDTLFDAVQIFNPEGRFLLSFGSHGDGNGQFWLPGGIYVAADNKIYVADTYNQRIEVFLRLVPDGDSDGHE